MTYSDPKKQKEAQHESYLRNKNKFLSRNTHRRHALREWLFELTKGVKCYICGESERACIDYHHLDPSTKHAEIGQMLSETRSKKKIEEELKKCIPLCSNCHRKFHAGLIDKSTEEWESGLFRQS